MFAYFGPGSYRRGYRHGRRHGWGRRLFWGLLIGPWLFRRMRAWANSNRRGGRTSGRDPRYI